MNRDSGWRVVAEGHGIMGAILEEPIAQVMVSWMEMAQDLGFSFDEAMAWRPDIESAYATRAADINRSEVERRARDLIHRLCKLVKEAGGTVTLYGRPVDEGTLRSAAMFSALARVAGHDQEQIVNAVLDEAGIPVAPSPPERKETDHDGIRQLPDGQDAALQPTDASRGRGADAARRGVR